MDRRLALFGSTCLVLWLCIGCTTRQGMVRGQSPPQAGEPGAPSMVQTGNSHGHVRYRGSSRSGDNAGHENCPHCRAGNCHIHGAGGHGHGNGRDWKPTHTHYYTYDAPKDLVYPPANQPAAMVQYPYYTCKAPDDFFLK